MEEKKLDLNGFHGSMEFTRYSSILPKHLLTEGMKYVADTAGSYWLMDLADSHIFNSPEDFIVIKLTKHDDGRAIIKASNGNNAPLWEQELEYTDFPEDQFVFWSIRNELGGYTHMLPTEY